MDCYKILRVSEDASDEEIYKSYISLLSNYSSAYNTSPYARRKQREIEKAYNIIQNELKRKVYSTDVKVEDVKEEIELFDYDAYKNTSDDVSFVALPLKDISLFKDVEAKVLEVDKKVIHVDVDYSFYVLKRKYKFEYKVKEKCNHSVDSLVECSTCNTIGKVEYRNGVVFCPSCGSSGSIKIHNCDYCNDYGYVYRNVSEYIYFDEDIIHNGVEKDNVIYKFNFINVDKVVEEKNHVYITYDLSYEESTSIVDIRWDTLHGPIIIKGDSTTLKKEYVFDGEKKIHIILNKMAYKGESISKYLFVRPSDLHKKIYLDVNKGVYNDSLVGNYNKEIIVTGEEKVVLPGLGKDGVNGGEKGDLILTPIITGHTLNIDNVEEYNIVKLDTTSKFNVLGGKVDGNFFIGLKGKNAAYVKDKTIYILSGKSKDKIPMYRYFWASILIYALWVFMPLLLVILPYTEQDLIVACVFTIVYSIVANIVLNLKG